VTLVYALKVGRPRELSCRLQVKLLANRDAPDREQRFKVGPSLGGKPVSQETRSLS